MTFHTFYAKPHKGQTPLLYDSEATWSEIVEGVLHDPVRPKIECPAIVLNRFKPDEKGRIKNRYVQLQETTGWFGVDVDNCGPLTSLTKKELFDKIPELKLVWISPSGKGVKAIGYTPLLKGLNPSRWRSEYRIFTLISARTKCRFKINFDDAMSRCHQPIFINSDPNAFVR